MEVGHTCHYVMGGIDVEAESAQATLPGLFAAGEAAAGLHGANRLGGNSLSDLLVCGRRAGAGAAQYAGKAPAVNIDDQQIAAAEKEMLDPFSRTDGENPYAVHRDLQKTMQSLVGIFRTGEDLNQAMIDLVQLKQRAARVGAEGAPMFTPGWHPHNDHSSIQPASQPRTP